jgi:hypothetical protein
MHAAAATAGYSSYGEWAGRCPESFVAATPTPVLLRLLQQHVPVVQRQGGATAGGSSGLAAMGVDGGAAAPVEGQQSSGRRSLQAAAADEGSLFSTAEREQLLQLLPACDRAALSGDASALDALADRLAPAAADSSAPPATSPFASSQA